MKELIIILFTSLLLFNFVLLILALTLPFNEYEWMRDYTNDIEIDIPVDEDNPSIIQDISIIVIILSFVTLSFSSISHKVRFPFFIIPIFLVFMRHILHYYLL